MIISILYLVAVAIAVYATNGTYQPNAAHILMAAGIIGICSALHDIENQIRRNKS